MDYQQLNGHADSNWLKWQSYCSGFPSPQNYIDWAWLYLVGAALQRRVWLGAAHKPLFANKYIILIGEPGIGKGWPIDTVNNFLTYWLRKNRYRINDDLLTAKQKQDFTIMEESFVTDAQKNTFQGKAKAAELIEAILYPIAADATTYEALVEYVAKSYTFIDYIEKDEVGNNKLKYYGHSSICFALPELASLMRKRTDDTVNFMLGLYDCPTDYEYKTKTQGQDRIRRGCINFLAGTTPSFMQSTFDDKLANEGWNSRTFYIYAKKNRQNVMFSEELNPQQKQYEKDILEHIRRLSGLYGPVRLDDTTKVFLQNWWDKVENDKSLRANKSLKLKAFYSRRNIHVQKLAMARHFGESLDMFIPKSDFEWAIEFLSEEEKNMHMAITFDGDNPIAKIGNKITEMLFSGDRNFVDIYVDCHYLGNKNQITEAIDMLGETKQIDSYSKIDEDTQRKTTWYKMI
jgi:hypothetical protein